MSIARAFTTRRLRHSTEAKDGNVHRSNTTSRAHGHTGSIRSMISAPIELTQATNILAYNAPDLQSTASDLTWSPKSPDLAWNPRSPDLTWLSKASDDESDSGHTHVSSPPTSPDTTTTDMAEPNHLSIYFTAPGQKLPSSIGEAPKVPLRSPLHTKQASYEHLAQKSGRASHQSHRTVSSSASLNLSRSSSTSTTSSSIVSAVYTHVKSATPPVTYLTSPPSTMAMPARRKEGTGGAHPFGHELAQVSETAEEFGVKDKVQVMTKEEGELYARGLCVFGAEDYLAEVQALFSTFFSSDPQPVWI